MASIQCAIELHDGVTPVLREIAAGLEGFGGRLTRFGEEMGALTPDTEGLAHFGGALNTLTHEAEGANSVMRALLDTSVGITRVFSEDVFLPLTTGAAAAVTEIEGIVRAAKQSAEELTPVFTGTTAEVAARFDEMGAQISRTFDDLGRQAAETAGGLPGHFAGPLAQIAAMFHAMAASARAAMDSIMASARNAVSAMNQVSSAAARPQISAFSAGGTETVTLFGTPSRETLTLPDPEMYGVREPATPMPPPTVTVTVQNENHIAHDVDVEMVLREMETRICDAVASSVEGVYA